MNRKDGSELPPTDDKRALPIRFADDLLNGIESVGKHKATKALVGRVRLAVNEIMSKKDIVKMLEDRVRSELTGGIDRYDGMRVTPTMLKIAAETWIKGPTQPGQGSQHVHFHGWTAEQMLEFAKTGKRPTPQVAGANGDQKT